MKTSGEIKKIIEVLAALEGHEVTICDCTWFDWQSEAWACSSEFVKVIRSKVSGRIFLVCSAHVNQPWLNSGHFDEITELYEN